MLRPRSRRAVPEQLLVGQLRLVLRDERVAEGTHRLDRDRPRVGQATHADEHVDDRLRRQADDGRTPDVLDRDDQIAECLLDPRSLFREEAGHFWVAPLDNDWTAAVPPPLCRTHLASRQKKTARITSHAPRIKRSGRSGGAVGIPVIAYAPTSAKHTAASSIVIHPNARGSTPVSAHIFPMVHHQTPRANSAAGMSAAFAAAPRPSVTTVAPAIVPSTAPDRRTGS